MRRLQLNTTLPQKDLDFIRDNAMTMTLTEMGKRLKCSAGKVGNNARIAGIELPQVINMEHMVKLRLLMVNFLM